MVNLQLDWQQSTVLTAALVLGGLAARRERRTAGAAPYLHESAIIAALYTLWQVAGSVTLFGTSGALARGRWIEHAQRDLLLPDERDLQRLILHHSLLAQLCNLYYASMHFGVLGIFLLWLFVRHRDRYAYYRNVLAVSTAICLLISFLPVAPPRLLPELGFVDVAAEYGQSVYDQSVITVDALAAMPSVHVLWAVLVGWAVVKVGHSRYRWIALAHPVVTVFVVVATGNHFWLDGIVAVLVLLATVAAGSALMRMDHRDARRSGVRHRSEGIRRLVEADVPRDEARRIKQTASDLIE
ncbi:phosphatase PAP2 family protein [Jatrophihabitans telluris]|uniref:Phosphatase PAP2 family protein n=1 Tax=Jatrophihabitans telluris TaxID=2038343 RepID=A0ABY4QUR2_9ACTN|nr:phosphatase PAP2 family protein [Jatrophihabitans telluris]UQX86730.1 phosphatase PAP2 family protein [Jatrophihabitans telluris]